MIFSTTFRHRNGAFHWLIRTGLGLMFIYSGAVKMIDPANFAENIKEFEIAGPRLTELLTYGIPAMEFVAGVILAIGIRSLWRGAAGVLVCMLLTFTFIVALAWARGLTVSCGCFGDTSHLPTSPAFWIARNVVIALALITLVRKTALQPVARV